MDYHSVYSNLVSTLEYTKYDHLDFETGLMLYFKRENYHCPTEYRMSELKDTAKPHNCTVIPLARRWGRPRSNPDDRDEFLISHRYPAHTKLAALIDAVNKKQETSWHFYGRDVQDSSGVCCTHVTGILPEDPLARNLFLYYVNLLEIPMKYPKWVSTAYEFTNLDIYLLRGVYYDVLDHCGTQFPPEVREKIDTSANFVTTSSRDPNSLMRFLKADWTPPTMNLPSLAQARSFLNERLLGMEQAKERLLQILEKMRRSGSPQYNLLFVGEPGVGKTSLINAYVELLNLPMMRISMSASACLETFVGFGKSFRDSQEGSFTTQFFKPYKIIRGRQTPVSGAARVVFLSELDKLSDKNQGTQNVLLEMLDDSHIFYDVYHEFHYPVNVLFIGDANDLSNLPSPLLDRFEVVEVHGYSTDEKAEIFHRFSFPAALKEAHVSPAEVSVTPEAVQEIASSCRDAGVRMQRHIADQIVGHYLTHFGQDFCWSHTAVEYTPDMVREFLPDTFTASLPVQPGSIRSAVLASERVFPVDVQCSLESAEAFTFTLYGSSNPMLRQELECSALCALRLLGDTAYHVRVQIYGLDSKLNACGQLGLACSIAVLSQGCGTVLRGVFHGSVTLLGGLVDTTPGDDIAAHTDAISERVLYTAKGFSSNIRRMHSCSVVEFSTLSVAFTLLLEDVRKNRDAS